MDVQKYEALKSDKEKLLQEIVLSSFCEDDLIYSFSDDFKMNIIKQFIDLDDPAVGQHFLSGTNSTLKFQ